MGAILIVLLIVGAVIAAGLVGGAIWGVSRSSGWIDAKSEKALKAAKDKQKAYAYLDASTDVSPDAVKKVCATYVNDPVLGSYADDVLKTFAREENRKAQLIEIINAEFEPNSLTWDKYSVPLDTAEAALTSNAAQIANHMQAFDSKEFDHLGRMDRAGALNGKETERKRLWNLQKELAKMDELQASNEKILVELEHLQSELNQMSAHGLTAGTDEVLEEIKRLADEAKYYA
jgi:hypothetical protein